MNGNTRNIKRTWDFGNIALWAGQGLLARFSCSPAAELLAPAEI